MSQQSSRLARSTSKRLNTAFPGDLLCSFDSCRGSSHQPNCFDAMGEWLERAIQGGFGAGSRQGDVMNRDWGAPASSSPLAPSPDREGCSFSDVWYLFLHHFRACWCMLTEILRKAISPRYRQAVSALPGCVSAFPRHLPSQSQ